ncbi:MAG: hypothetical protein H6671_08415 [Anaerolineaceae bacterium]|nr:hypothetical protein [Anaerolineaceae bacterium]
MTETVTPDTGAYLVLGLVVIFTILAAFIGSMVIRYRSLKKDAQLLDQFQQD